MVVWKEIELNLFRFRNRLTPLTQIPMGLEEYLISKYKYNYKGDTTFFKLASHFLLNYFYKEDRDDYKYKDIFVFFKEIDLIKHLEAFKNLLDIYIIHHIEPDFIDIEVVKVLENENDKLRVLFKYSVNEVE